MIRKFRSRSTSIILILTISSFMTTNCSILGMGIGSAIDRSRPDYEDIGRWEIGRAKEGRHMILYLNDGSLADGQYAGMVALKDSVYNKRYYGDQSGAGEQRVLPAIGDTVEIIVGNEIPRKYLFRCFIYKYKKDAEKIVFFPGLEHQYVLAKPFEGGGNYSEILLAGIRAIKLKDGITISRDALKSMHAENSLPLKTAIKVQIDSSSFEYFPINDIEHVSIPIIKHTGTTLFIAGLFFDAAIAGVLISLNNVL